MMKSISIYREQGEQSCAKGLCTITLCHGNVKTRETSSAEILSKGLGNLQWEYFSLSLPHILKAHPQRDFPNNKTSNALPGPEGSNTEVWCVQIN